jgi:hypothetical protein
MTQLAALLLFAVLTICAWIKFRAEQLRTV